MANNLLSEAERYLVTRWDDARHLELSMEEVRRKYAGLFGRIAEAVASRHKRLSQSYIRVTQHWADGVFGIGDQRWRTKSGDLQGFYIEGLRLEVLASEEDSPWAGIWISKIDGREMAAAREKLYAASKGLLTRRERELAFEEKPGEECALWYHLPEKQTQLLDMLAADDGRGFVDCMVGHIDLLARFSPVLDRILMQRASRRR